MKNYFIPYGENKNLVLTLEDLDAFLKDATDILKGIMNPSDSKQYIMGLLFIKRLSDQFNEDYAKIDKKDNPEDPDHYQYYIPAESRWENIRKTAEGIGKKIDEVCEKLEEANPEKLEGVLTPIQFYQPNKLTDTNFSKLITHFSKIGYNLANSNLENPKLIGQAYVSLIEKVAEASGKKGGDFYTTKEVVETLVRILAPDEGMRICDPVCGSGGFLIACNTYLEDQGKNAQNLSLSGEEVNTGTWAIAKMNLLLHNIFDAELVRGNTVQEPILEDGKLKQYDICVGNPIWNQEGGEWAIDLYNSGDPYHRASYGISPKGSGDWMWIQHMNGLMLDLRW